MLKEYHNISNLIDNTIITNTNDVISLCKLKSLSLPIPSSVLSILSSNTGNIIRIYVNDIPAPSYHVWRTESFGIIIESCWALYSSFKLPLIGECTQLEQFIWTNESDMFRTNSPYPCPYPYPLT